MSEYRNGIQTIKAMLCAVWTMESHRQKCKPIHRDLKFRYDETECKDGYYQIPTELVQHKLTSEAHVNQ
jgi:hypothetical protein